MCNEFPVVAGISLFRERGTEKDCELLVTKLTANNEPYERQEATARQRISLRLNESLFEI